MRASIIATVYNHKPFLEALVCGVKSQSLKDFECIILDDCSTDGSYEVLKKLVSNDSRFLVLQTPRNLGDPTSAIDSLLPTLNGEYLYRIDGDDAPLPSFLSTLCNILGADSHLAFAACKCWSMNPKSEIWGRPRAYSYRRSGASMLQTLIKGNCLCAPGIVYRTSVIKSLGGFFHSRPLKSKDWVANMKCCTLGDFYFHGESLACYRIHFGGWGQTVRRSPTWDKLYGGSILPLEIGLDVARDNAIEISEELRIEAFQNAWRSLQGVMLQWKPVHDSECELKKVVENQILEYMERNGIKFARTPLKRLFIAWMYGAFQVTLSKVAKRDLLTVLTSEGR